MKAYHSLVAEKLKTLSDIQTLVTFIDSGKASGTELSDSQAKILALRYKLVEIDEKLTALKKDPEQFA